MTDQSYWNTICPICDSATENLCLNENFYTCYCEKCESYFDPAKKLRSIKSKNSDEPIFVCLEKDIKIFLETFRWVIEFADMELRLNSMREFDRRLRSSSSVYTNKANEFLKETVFSDVLK